MNRRLGWIIGPIYYTSSSAGFPTIRFRIRRIRSSLSGMSQIGCHDDVLSTNRHPVQQDIPFQSVEIPPVAYLFQGRPGNLPHRVVACVGTDLFEFHEDVGAIPPIAFEEDVVESLASFTVDEHGIPSMEVQQDSRGECLV